MDNYKKLVGKKIRQRRRELGLKNQADLADLVGTDQSRVSRWETGEDFPDEYKQLLIEHLQVTENYLFGEGPAPPEPPNADVIFDYVKGLESQIEALKRELAAKPPAPIGPADPEERMVIRAMENKLVRAMILRMLTGSDKYKEQILTTDLDPPDSLNKTRARRKK